MVDRALGPQAARTDAAHLFSDRADSSLPCSPLLPSHPLHTPLLHSCYEDVNAASPAGHASLIRTHRRVTGPCSPPRPRTPARLSVPEPVFGSRR
uniref:Uncharacterized protein n=1 Tax=Knipowitschia caucasica TaxID=637954 RepID=A0AAV2KTC7_KNICA